MEYGIGDKKNIRNYFNKKEKVDIDKKLKYMKSICL